MTALKRRRHGPLDGELRMPGDKAISHRAVLISAIAAGSSSITGLNDGDDVRRTAAAVRSFGVAVAAPDSSAPLEVQGLPLGGWRASRGRRRRRQFGLHRPHAGRTCGRGRWSDDHHRRCHLEAPSDASDRRAVAARWARSSMAGTTVTGCPCRSGAVISLRSITTPRSRPHR